MSIAGIYEIIAAIALIIVGIFVAYDGLSSRVWGFAGRPHANLLVSQIRIDR